MSIRNLLIALSLSTVAYAGGPAYMSPNYPPSCQNNQQTCWSEIYNEMVNVYRSIGQVPNSTFLASSMTLNGLTVTSETVKNKLTIPNGSASTDAAAFGQIKLNNYTMTGPSNATSTTSTSFVGVAGSTITITPKSSSDKILIIYNAEISDLNAFFNTYVTIMRGSVNLGGADGFGYMVTGSSTESGEILLTVIVEDSPSTTSAVSYSAMMRSQSASNTAWWNRDSLFWFAGVFEFAP